MGREIPASGHTAGHPNRFSGGGSARADAANVERAKHKEPVAAAESALALMLRADATFLKNGGCFSCHAQNITTMATAIAREKKIPFDQAGAAEILRGNKLQFAAQTDSLLERFDPPAALISSIALLAMGFDGAPADRITDALVLNLAAQQSIDGRWIGSGGVSRPPTADGDMSGTAISIYALRHYAPPALKADFDRRIAKAAAWLMNEKPVTTEDTVMQLLGAKWSGADSAAIGKLARQVLALQRTGRRMGTDLLFEIGCLCYRHRAVRTACGRPPHHRYCIPPRCAIPARHAGR